MRKLSLLMLMFALFAFTTHASEETKTESETVEVTEEKENSKFKEAMKKVFKKEEGVAEDDEEEKAFPLSLGLDLVSRYVWRGIDFGASPAIQPYVEYSAGKGIFSWGIGAWGSYAFTGAVASEMDLYSYISVGPVTLNFTDYFFPSEVWGGDKYFTYTAKKNTGHVYELMLSIGGDKAPIYGTAAVNLGGADTEFSSYFEIGATVYDGIDLFIGAAYDNYQGYYLAKGKQKFNVINVGMSVSHDIEVKKVSIPIGAQLIFNPEARNVWFVASIGLSN